MKKFDRMLRFTLGAGLILLPASALAVSTINSIDFQIVDSNSQLLIQADGPVTYETQENAEGHLIVLELKGAKLGPKAKRKLDTSSFNSRIDLISPYQPKDQADTARIVLHLRDMASAEVSQENNTIKVVIPNTGSAGGDTAAKDNKDAPPEGDAAAPADAPDAGAKTAKADAPPGEAAPKVEKTNLDEFVENTETKRFTGKPITLQVRDAELSDVLRLIGEASGFNIVVGDGVGGKITLSLIDVPWDQALDVILHTKRLGAERRANILRIVTLQNLTTEKEEQFKAKEAAKKSAPRVTRIFPVSYADAKELVPILNNFGNSASQTLTVGGAAPAASNAQNGPVQVDSRTNSLIVQDIPENIERMRKLIALLDTQTPQVMVEAKVVEATERFGKNISGSLGFGSTTSNNPQAFASFNGANPVDPLLGTPGVFAAGTNVASAQTNPGTGIFGLSPSISFIPGISRLNALLNLQESEDKVKIISSPKLVVLNKKEAQIISGQPVLVPQTQNIPGLPSSTITTVQNANLSLDVTPTVTNSGSVHMVLKIQRDLVTSQGSTSLVAPRNMNTEVLVDSGTTLVIGGIYSTDNTHSESGFPILKDLPILGWLFGNKTDSTQRSELFIFITPRVINEEEAGLTS